MPHTETLRVPFATADREAFFAAPDEPGPHPGVVVVHDLTGFRRDTRRHCEKFAAAGYAAIAPDLYAGGKVGCIVRTILSMRTHRGEAYGVIAAARETLAARTEVDEERLGIVGFCMGGGFALIAAADDRYAVAGPFYGMVPSDAERLQGICPTIAQYGTRDMAFASHAQRLVEHLETLGVEHDVIVHPGVGHSFMNNHEDAMARVAPYLPPLFACHDGATEEAAWHKLLAFFEQHLSND